MNASHNTKESFMKNPPAITPQKTRIGFIGSGVMGRSMAGHILEKG
jgi:3-hydroxyisobutyrate dehydrogenase